MKEHNKKAIPYMTTSLSEQQEAISVKNRNINKNENAITIQYAQSAESGMKVLRYTLANRNIG